MNLQSYLLPALTFALAFMVSWVFCKAAALKAATSYLVKYEAIDETYRTLVSMYFGSAPFYCSTIGLLAAGLVCVVST